MLRNQLGIRSVREMARRESEALVAATPHMVDETRVDQRFAAIDVRHMHRPWLAEIYERALRAFARNLKGAGYRFFRERAILRKKCRCGHRA